jgi:hypothetical protein
VAYVTKKERDLVECTLSLVETILLMEDLDNDLFLGVIDDVLKKVRVGLFTVLKIGGCAPPYISFPGGNC